MMFSDYDIECGAFTCAYCGEVGFDQDRSENEEEKTCRTCEAENN